MVMATATIEQFAPVTFNLNNNHTLTPVKTDFFLENHQNGAVLGKHLIGDALRCRVESIDHESCEPGDEDTFFVGDLGEVYRQHMRWKKNLPRVLQLLAALGTGFDCASKAEIEQVLNMGVDAERIIYAQPCKTNSYVRYVANKGVKQMTFDNADELRKIAKLYPEAELFLRILTDDSSSLCRLSLKFGASLDDTDNLLSLAKELGLNVVGVSFHVGSGASDPLCFLKAVQDADTVFKQAYAHGFDLKTLDVGGGFSGDSFEAMATPGRYYVSSAFTIACNIIARRTIHNPATGESSYMAYVNDGLYGNFSSIMFDHQQPIAKILSAGQKVLFDSPTAEGLPARIGGGIEYSIWGPTCDGIDRITESIRFDHELDVGDWLYFEDMGAYTKCSATKFNGFSDAHDVVYVCSEPGARAVLGL
ncbi:ornithine decarboxylase [Apiospora phragmitis]|uniref:Ornithine decarboxylase n=1 Tax=Apiospora phragmitis TaxID=2905665 RepID=A0ABR1W6Y5_9PEZI